MKKRVSEYEKGVYLYNFSLQESHSKKNDASVQTDRFTLFG